MQTSLGRDVISFSRSGAGNYDGAAIFAFNTRRLVERYGVKLASPHILVVYFYEGNDIQDNIRFFRRHYQPFYDVSKIFDDDYFNFFSSEMEQRHCRGLHEKFEGNFLLAKALGSFLERFVKRRKLRQHQSLLNGPIAATHSGVMRMDGDVLGEDVLHL